MRSRRLPRAPEFDIALRSLYQSLCWSIPRIAKYFHCSASSIYRDLLRLAIPRRPSGGKRWFKCSDCSKPTAGARRCPFHQKTRQAERCLAWRESHPHAVQLYNRTVRNVR